MKEKTEREIALFEAALTIPLEKGFQLPDRFPIPLRKFLWVKKIERQGEDAQNKTEAGILLIDSIAKNTIIPDMAVIYNVGPEVTEMLRPGLRVMINPFNDTTVMIKGITYHRVMEEEIYSIIPPEGFVHVGVKSDRQIIREGRAAGMERAEKRDDKIGEKRAADRDDKHHASNNLTKRKNQQLKTTKK